MAFIERCSAHKFNISEEEYNKLVLCICTKHNIIDNGRNMGYVDGKTDLDLILAEDKTAEEEELLLTSQVCVNSRFLILLLLHKSCSVVP